MQENFKKKRRKNFIKRVWQCAFMYCMYNYYYKHITTGGEQKYV